MRLLHCAAAVAVPVIASTAQPVVHALPCCCRHRAMRESVQNGNLAAQNTAVQQLAAPPLAAAPLPLLQFGGVLRCAATVMATRRFVRCCRAAAWTVTVAAAAVAGCRAIAHQGCARSAVAPCAQERQSQMHQLTARQSQLQQQALPMLIACGVTPWPSCQQSLQNGCRCITAGTCRGQKHVQRCHTSVVRYSTGSKVVTCCMQVLAQVICLCKEDVS